MYGTRRTATTSISDCCCKGSVFLDNISFVNGKMFCKCFNFPFIPLISVDRLPIFASFSNIKRHGTEIRKKECGGKDTWHL